MWLLLWFQLETNVTHFEVGQYSSEKDCTENLRRASILVTKNNEYLQCFKVNL